MNEHIPPDLDWASMSMSSPEAFTVARAAAAGWIKELESRWNIERKRTYKDRLSAEFERLIHVFVGPDGLGHKTWGCMSRKLELTAIRQIQRQDILAFQEYRTQYLNSGDIAAAALQLVNNRIKAAKRGWSSRPHDRSGDKASMHQHLLGRSPRASRGSDNVVLIPFQGLSEPLSQCSEEGSRPGSQLLRRATGSKDISVTDSYICGPDKVMTHVKEGLQAPASLDAAPGLQQFQALRVSPAPSTTLSTAAYKSPLARNSTAFSGSLFMSGRRSMVSSRSGKRLAVGTGGKTSIHVLQSRRANMTPICQRLFDLCVELNVPNTPELLDMMAVSELGSQMEVSGISMQTSTTKALASVLPLCRNITGLRITRTVMLPESSEILLMAACCLPLKSLELVGTDLKSESIHHLITAMQRPTATAMLPPHELVPVSQTQPATVRKHVHLGDRARWEQQGPETAAAAAVVTREMQEGGLDPEPGGLEGGILNIAGAARVRTLSYLPTASSTTTSMITLGNRPLGPNLWCSLVNLNLTGNNVGDEGFQKLVPHLCGLERLGCLTVRQTGLTDWSAPQIGQLLQASYAHLKEIDLSSNRLGPLTTQAIAAVLPVCRGLQKLSLAWNGLTDGIHHLAWALLKISSSKIRASATLCALPASKSSAASSLVPTPYSSNEKRSPNAASSLTHLDICGTNPNAQDLMALAAVLRFGSTLPLSCLDLRHNDLLGVSSQCLLRQVHVRMLDREEEGDPSSDQQGRGKNEDIRHLEQSSDEDGGSEIGTKPLRMSRGRVVGTDVKVLTAGCKVCETDPFNEELVWSGLGMVCENAERRQRSTEVRPGLPAGGGQMCGLDEEESSVCVSGRMSLQQRRAMASFELDLAQPAPDRMIARLLVEQEVHARSRHRVAWHSMALDDMQYRLNGKELEPFDVVYEGWLADTGLPELGLLCLKVLPLHDHECPWLRNKGLEAVREFWNLRQQVPQ
ncbi:hypothetical protein CEUSTIGMA_g2160.t1 [Chlamydomonas eustigma]|uniref:Uncharacterized protein n=1 Tax=Chlamydomonas eustigma TaxID=1157962 RepID=A0A250WVR2_9CHLO|nr:hypothetical protein CEUSTIGMA_g2160.t1 [Chlamydomonas eustigma]|eukprot:GAX74712.1 hypothetical protein CEUSTIGMA_g2160.t1 [Chlamydomonas eustigma]